MAEPATGADIRHHLSDALYVKMRHEGRVENRRVMSRSVSAWMDSRTCWIMDGGQGVEAWLTFITEFRNRGVRTY